MKNASCQHFNLFRFDSIRSVSLSGHRQLALGQATLDLDSNRRLDARCVSVSLGRGDNKFASVSLYQHTRQPLVSGQPAASTRA